MTASVHWSHSRLRNAAASTFFLALSACTAPVKAPAPGSVASYEQRWSELDLSDPGLATKEGYHREVDLIHSPLFRTLPTKEQHDRLREAAVLAIRVYKDYSTGQEFSRRSSEMPEAVFQDWEIRLAAAYFSGDHLEEMRTLTELARHWAIELRTLNAPGVLRIAQYPPKSPAEKKARFELLEALYSADWMGEDGVAPYYLWGELTAELCEKGQVNRALEIARQVALPRFVLWMRVDRRFDALVAKDPEAFDIGRTAERDVDVWASAANRTPHRLDPIVHLTYAFLDVGRYQEALNITGGVLSKVRDAADFKQVFDDDETGLNWILDYHSRALVALQNWKDAEWELRAAADRLEDGHRNVSNVINLGGFEAKLGRGEEALKIIAELPEDPGKIAPFGYMQAYDVRLMAALEQGDTALEDQCIKYMQAHQADAPATYEEALVRANRSDEAANLLIRRLKDPETRHDALLGVQHYRDRPLPPEDQRVEERWREIVQRKDVQKAIARVGRVIDVPLPRVLW